MKKIAVGASVVLSTIAVAACGSSSSSSSSSSSGTTTTNSTSSSAEVLKIGNFLPVTSWDTAQGGSGFNPPYFSAVYDSLVMLGPNGAVQPDLAKSWSVSADGKTVTLNLRSGVKFSDGSAFNAAAAVANVNYLKKGAMTSSAYSGVESVKAAGPERIVFTLGHPDSAFLYNLSINSYIASPKALANPKKLAVDPDGSGPYTLDASKSQAGSVYYFVRRAGYWNAKEFPWSSVQISAITDSASRQNAMLSGQVNVEYALPSSLSVAKQHGWNVSSAVGTWVGINFVDRTGKVSKPLGSAKVRQAINFAFNGPEILKALDSGAGVATNQVFVDGAGREAALDQLYSYNVAKAKQLLDAAGYPNGFSITMPMSPAFEPYQAIATQSLAAIGIKVTWQNMSQIDYQDKLGNYGMYLCVLALDANAEATVQHQIEGPTWTDPLNSAASDPTLSALIKQMNSSTGSALTAVISKINNYVTNNAWFAVWAQADNVYFSTSNIKVTPVVGVMFPPLQEIQPAS